MEMQENAGSAVADARGKNMVPQGKTPRLVERKTELRGQSICRPREPRSGRRQCTQRDIYGKDPEVPYVKYETAHRDLVCSLMERQDRMNEEIFVKLIDLEYRIHDIEMEAGPAGESP